MYDMQTQTDLTAAKKGGQPERQVAKQPEIKFSDLPLSNAIKTVRGTGQRKLAVFSDPQCPYCQQLEVSLAKLKDVTIYTFLYPLQSLHPEAPLISERIWCSSNRVAAWQAFMLKGQRPTRVKDCETPLLANIQLAGKYGIQGTPFIVFDDDTSAPGALDLAALERRLNAN
jgi:thiol:disulfide interchange protein DsbC